MGAVKVAQTTRLANLAVAIRSMICNTDVVEAPWLDNLIGEAGASFRSTSPKVTMGIAQPYDPGSAPFRRSRPSPLWALTGRDADVSRDIARLRAPHPGSRDLC
jgi:hypothetical protein